MPSASRRSSRPVRVSSTKSDFQFSRPYDVDESENHTVPSARDRGVVAEDHAYAVDAVGHRLDAAGAGVDAEQPSMSVADQEPPVGIDLEAERAAGGLGDPVDLGAVGADPPDRAVPGAGEHRPLVRAVGRDDDVLGAGAGHGHDGDAVLDSWGVSPRPCWRRGASRGTPGPRSRRTPSGPAGSGPGGRPGRCRRRGGTSGCYSPFTFLTAPFDFSNSWMVRRCLKSNRC